MLDWMALLPVVVVLAALLWGMRALHAAWLGVGVAVVVALLQAQLGVPLPEAAALAAALQRWWPVVLEVVFIIGGGLALSQFLQACGAQAAMADWLRQRAGQGVGAVLLVVHGVTPFAESVTGFGIGVTVGIPLLLHLGLPAARAALVGLLGLCTVPWGSMAPGTLIAANMSGLPFDALGVASAQFSLVPFLVTGWLAAWLSGAEKASLTERARDWALATASALLLWLAVWQANRLFGTPPAGALGALVVMGAHLLLRRGRWPALSRPAALALLAYAVVLGGLLLARWVVLWEPLTSPALWLWLATLGVWAVMRAGGLQAGNVQAESVQPVDERALCLRVARGWSQVAWVTLAYIALGLVLSLTGMAARLAESLAGLGSAYALLAPWVAALGGFVTGSNTAANAMLADVQARMAEHIGAPLLPFMAAHNVAAALLLMASPAKVEMAVQLCPMQAAQQRAWVQRMVLLAALPSVLALSGLGVLGVSV